MSRFIIDPPALSVANLDRSEDRREPGRLAASWRAARLLVVSQDGALPVLLGDDGARLVFTEAAEWGAQPPRGAILLGTIGDVDYWALSRWLDAAHRDQPYRTVRVIGPLLGDDEAALATTAVALARWHADAAFCSRCGRPTAADFSGHSRTCPAGHQEFPRTDPAVIVLVHDGADSAVLARQPSWAPGRFSVLAGFAEAGESLEATVAREIGEEVGIPVDQVEYLGSQPWPFPRSLMIGFAARAPQAAVLRPRPGEIEDARWFSREELRVLLSRDADRHDEVAVAALPAPGITLPGPVSIARRMVEAFVRAD